MQLSHEITVEEAERVINNYLENQTPTEETYFLTMRYIFFKMVTAPGMLGIFRSLKESVPPQYKTTEEARRHIVGATLLNAEKHSAMRVFERNPADDPREFRIATDFDIRFDFPKGGVYVPRGKEKGPFVPYNDVYGWMNMSII